MRVPDAGKQGAPAAFDHACARWDPNPRRRSDRRDALALDDDILVVEEAAALRIIEPDMGEGDRPRRQPPEALRHGGAARRERLFLRGEECALAATEPRAASEGVYEAKSGRPLIPDRER